MEGGKVPGASPAGHIGLAAPVHRDAKTLLEIIGPTAAQVGGVGQGAQGREFGHEHIRQAGVCWLERHGGGKVR